MSSHDPPIGGRSINLAGMKSVEELAREFEDVITDRLRRVERSNRVLRSWVGVLGVLVALLMGSAAFLVYQVLTGAPALASSRLTAREFVLADAGGRVRGTWTVGADGNARIALMDREGKPRLRLTVLGDNGAPGISLLDERGTSRLGMGILPDGATSLVLADGAGHSRTVLGVAGDAVNLVFADRFGVTRAGVGVDASGRPDVSVFDQATQEDAAGADSAAPQSPAAPGAPAAAPPAPAPARKK